MRVIISAGGTGGHIYPALAIINKIKEKEPDSEFLYIGTHNRMEKDIVPSKGIPFESIEMYGFNKKNLFKNFKTVKCLMQSFKRCRKLIKDFNPDIVIGVGGYVTVPVIVSAKKLGYKTFLHEQNSLPGKSNKYLAKYSDLIGVSFESSIKSFIQYVEFDCTENRTRILNTNAYSNYFGLGEMLEIIPGDKKWVPSENIFHKMVRNLLCKNVN